MPTKRRRKLVSLARGPDEDPSKSYDRWALGFVSDQLTRRTHSRVPTVINVLSLECVGIEVASDMKVARVGDALNKMIARRGAKPQALALDNGMEFHSMHFDIWAHGREIGLDFIQSGKPVENDVPGELHWEPAR